MDCKYCGCPMMVDETEVHPLSCSWHLQYCISYWICPECGAVAIVDSSASDLWGDPTEWTGPDDEEAVDS